MTRFLLRVTQRRSWRRRYESGMRRRAFLVLQDTSLCTNGQAQFFFLRGARWIKQWQAQTHTECHTATKDAGRRSRALQLRKDSDSRPVFVRFGLSCVGWQVESAAGTAGHVRDMLPVPHLPGLSATCAQSGRARALRVLPMLQVVLPVLLQRGQGVWQLRGVRCVPV